MTPIRKHMSCTMYFLHKFYMCVCVCVLFLVFKGLSKWGVP